MSRTLGYADEPKRSGAVVVVHYGDYRYQEIWIASGLNVGDWYCLGGEFGRPEIVEDPRNELEKISQLIGRGSRWEQPAGTIPLHPTWRDVLARGPVTLLFPGNDDTYREGWIAGRHDFFGQIEEFVNDGPPNSAAFDGDVEARAISEEAP